MINFLDYLVLILSIINLFRMSLFLIGADIYSVRHHFKRKKTLQNYPTVSVLIPAYNESKTILDTIKSILKNNYPQNLIDITVIDDGSTDNTKELVEEFISLGPHKNVRVIKKENGGKAHALNHGLTEYAKGELVMCLDADAYLHQSAIKNAVAYFQDDQIVALASNVKIEPGKGMINLVQVYEYLMGYQMKKALTEYNIEYIIGGIGSMFRRTVLESVGYYDSNTITEDIDLTMKILQKGNKLVRVVYASDVVTYTQSAHSISDLIRQRFRWKWGRYQTFYKNRNLFFINETRFTKGLTWYYLPYAILSDVIFVLEPVMLYYILHVVFFHGDTATLLITVAIMTYYICMNIAAEETVSTRNKIKYMAFAPVVYFFLYLLSFVEYVALIKSVIKMPELKKSIKSNKSAWQPVQRSEFIQTK